MKQAFRLDILIFIYNKMADIPVSRKYLSTDVYGRIENIVEL